MLELVLVEVVHGTVVMLIVVSPQKVQQYFSLPPCQRSWPSTHTHRPLSSSFLWFIFRIL